jgi:hypothetical protein
MPGAMVVRVANGTTSLPTWLASAAVFEWVQISSTVLGNAQTGFTPPTGYNADGILKYSGGCVKKSGSELFVFGGGHLDSSGNDVYSLRLADNAPAWVKRRNPSATVAEDVTHYSDNRPSARHTYWTIQYNDSRDRMMTFGAPAVYGTDGVIKEATDGFNPSTNDWDAPGTYPTQTGMTYQAQIVGKDASDNVYVHRPDTSILYKWTSSSNSWSNLGNKGTSQYEVGGAVDTNRNRLLRIHDAAASEGYYDLANNGDFTSISFSGAQAAQIDGGSTVFDPVNDCYWFWKRGSSTLYKVAADSPWSCTTQSTTGSTPTNTVTIDGTHNIYGRFAYCPELKGIVFLRDTATNAYFLRTA